MVNLLFSVELKEKLAMNFFYTSQTPMPKLTVASQVFYSSL